MDDVLPTMTPHDSSQTAMIAMIAMLTFGPSYAPVQQHDPDGTHAAGQKGRSDIEA